VHDVLTDGNESDAQHEKDDVLDQGLLLQFYADG